MAGSDAHHVREVGACATRFQHPIAHVGDLARELKAGRAVSLRAKAEAEERPNRSSCLPRAARGGDLWPEWCCLQCGWCGPTSIGTLPDRRPALSLEAAASLLGGATLLENQNAVA